MPSLAWAVVRDGGVTGGGFGGAGPRTIFQAGSVTKIFTALLLADMAVGGEVRLSDPAARYLPGARNAASPVTLADLATHTAGLPRLPGGLSWSARLSPRDPYARYPASWFRRAARRALGAGSGGSPYAYSNFGYGLLGYLLGRAAESTYETLVTTRVCGPLGLADTTFGVPGPSRDRKAQGHQRGLACPRLAHGRAGRRGRALLHGRRPGQAPAGLPGRLGWSRFGGPAGVGDPRRHPSAPADPRRRDRLGLAPHPSW